MVGGCELGLALLLLLVHSVVWFSLLEGAASRILRFLVFLRLVD